MLRWLLVTLLMLPVMSASAQPQIKIVYPDSAQSLTAADSAFIFGQVLPATAAFSINNTPVRLYKNGAFLAFLPVQPGSFVFRCQAVQDSDTTCVERSVRVPVSPLVFPLDSLGLDTASVSPTEEIIAATGEELRIVLRATPGCSAQFKLSGASSWLPMVEQKLITDLYWGTAVFGDGTQRDLTQRPGYYLGRYRIQPHDTFKHAQVAVQIHHPRGDVLSYAFGNISVAGDSLPRVIELLPETTILRTGAGLVYHLFLPQDTRLVVTGKHGNFWQIHLAAGKDAWLLDGTFRQLPVGTPLPQSTIAVVRTENLNNLTRIHIPVQERLPFQIEQSLQPAELLVTIWGAIADTDWIRYDFNDQFIKGIRWQQPGSDVFQLTIELNLKQQWGYLAHYESDELLLDIRHSPKIAHGLFQSPLKARVICLDAGHHPDRGAVGPTGFEERRANWQITSKLKKMLEKKGATVYLTRSDEQGMSLNARPAYATLIQADVLLSIHNNALPDGVNPFLHNGNSSYYYHPQSQRLAQLLQRQLLKSLKLPDHGFYYANLALCRPTFMPAVLVEPAFMMIPEQEFLLQQDEFQMKVARALLKGLEQFFAENRQ